MVFGNIGRVSLQFPRHNGDGSQGRAELVRRAGGQRHHRGEPLVAGHLILKLKNFLLPAPQGIGNFSGEEGDQRGGDDEGDPHSDQVGRQTLLRM